MISFHLISHPLLNYSSTTRVNPLRYPGQLVMHVTKHDFRVYASPENITANVIKVSMF